MSEQTHRRITSADVARLAGVSRATVSYVMNDTPRQTISPSTRTRVLDAAARLGYSPSAAARTLRTGRSDVVLCLLPDWPIGPEVGSMLGNLSTALARHGLTLVVHPGNREDRPIGEIWKAITPAAVIAYTDFSVGEIAAMRSAGVALVVPIFGREAQPAVPQQLIGRQQAAHLITAGHTRLGYAYPDDERVRTFAEPRLAGVQDECRDSQVGGPATETVTLDRDQAHAAVRRWHAAGVTGVCAYNDEVALAVLAGVRLAGLTAPADLAVIGVDDIPPARLVIPSLTTVTTDQAAVAAYLSATVVAAINGRPAPAVPTADLVQLVRRESA
ncbi:DNA-binding LacI/PurR family transcriptional regulator [Actinoplanes tereljensis]|uniref:LacI family transcriptional regulator n=1 Tax=Paractinoplanes tereljensis TaxID=571912 RepID=A0A919NN81_9ACTN|nr:LacI family DNA-binding transcriptional regulator [Actinoplanes tereljensis]GIF20667.1 LacI family transcriptional regulator [Actinoplanes tereljensis]